MSSSKIQSGTNPNIQTASSQAQIRPPIVVVMGHVDHGKTTLLDYIRKTRAAEREAGGITQSIGAYEIERNGQRITFIDTPGHQAFSKMRERGANVADIAVLVVAADDGVKPQTEEALSILKNSKTPFLIAINKIDKNNADEERVRNSLAAKGVLLEGHGGDVSYVAVSAKTGEHIDDLLDLILLMWEVERPMCNSQGEGKGFVLESEMDSRRGAVASVVVLDGVLRTGDGIITSSARGKIKILEDFMGNRVEELTPSSPALIVGFEKLPLVGEDFKSGSFDVDSVLPAPELRKKFELVKEEGEIIKVIVKADVSGSLEALAQMISSMEVDGKKVKIVGQEVGDINDGDIKEAQVRGALVLGFRCKTSRAAENLSRAQHVKIISSDIIYRLVEALEEFAKEGEKEEMSVLEVLVIFSQKGKKQLIGGKVVSGFFTLNQRFIFTRGDEEIGRGKIINLQQEKADCRKVEKGECGMMVEASASISVSDMLVAERQ